MPIRHIDVLRTLIGMVDIVLIWDEENEATPHRGPRVHVRPLEENFEDTVEKSQGANQSTSKPIDTTAVKSMPGTRKNKSSSRSTPSAALVLIARVPKVRVPYGHTTAPYPALDAEVYSRGGGAD